MSDILLLGGIHQYVVVWVKEQRGDSHKSGDSDQNYILIVS